MKKLTALAALLSVAAGPALAASGPFFSLGNTDFIVLLGFLVFIAVLVYFNVPTMITKMLDDRAASIRSDLDEAKALREEAQTLLASFERKQSEVQEQADRIVETARKDAEAAADKAKDDIKRSVERRLAGAEEQIASARAAAVRDVRDTAIQVAVAAARDVIAEQMDASRQDKLIDDAIEQAGAKLH